MTPLRQGVGAQVGVSLVLSFFFVWDMPTIAAGMQTLRTSRFRAIYNEVAPTFAVFGRLFGKALQAQVMSYSSLPLGLYFQPVLADVFSNDNITNVGPPLYQRFARTAGVIALMLWDSLADGPVWQLFASSRHQIVSMMVVASLCLTAFAFQALQLQIANMTSGSLVWNSLKEVT